MEIDTATGQIGLDLGNEEYEAFEDKFKPKKTTDDCYTPENIYDVVAKWVETEYGVDRASFVRPFWPGADFTRETYPDGCVVVDNPPFSIRAEILDYFLAKDVRFFLFSPALTLLTRKRGVCHIAVGSSIQYANGAEVPTSFVTNLERGLLRTAPDLYKELEAANDINRRAGRKSPPKYDYPDNVVTAAIAQRWCHYGVEYRLEDTDATIIGALDAQKEKGKSIFGYGYLLSERAAAERAAAERAAAERWELSARERELVREMGDSQKSLFVDEEGKT